MKTLSGSEVLGYLVLGILIVGLMLWLFPMLVFMGIEHLFGYRVPPGFWSYFWFWVIHLLLLPKTVIRK